MIIDAISKFCLGVREWLWAGTKAHARVYGLMRAFCFLAFLFVCGYDTDIDSYYRRSELHILTSISETFPMAIAESKSYGMPLVMYELPFVELVRESKGKGIVSIPQGDIKMRLHYVPVPFLQCALPFSLRFQKSILLRPPAILRPGFLRRRLS